MTDPHAGRLRTRRMRVDDDSVTGAVLVLPGGKPNSEDPYRRWQLAGLRMTAFTSDLRRALGRSVFVEQVQYRYRGWNAPALPAVRDGEQALRSIRERFGSVPVVLVGHSMGGRVAAYLAGGPEGSAVTAVAALAPWWPEGEGGLVTSGQRLLVAHGSLDHWTDPRASRRQVEQAVQRGVSAEYVSFGGAGHFMLNRPGRWHRLTREFVVDSLTG